MTKEQEAQRSRKVQELGLARKIMDVLSRKADELANSTTVQQGKFKLEPAERVKLLEINNLGLTEGVAAGLLSLWALRRIRSSLLRRMWANSQRSATHGHPHAPPPTPPPPPPNATTNNPFRNNNPFQQHQTSQFNPPPPITPPPPSSNATPKQSTFMFIFGWLLDGVGAFSVMVTVSFMLTDINKILDKLSTIPLTEGRSTIAREFCPDVVQSLRKIKAEDADAAAIINDPQTKQLQAVLQFSENCQRRAAFEKQLRRDKGVGRHYPVDVPPPGVPLDFPFDSSLESGDGDDDSKQGNNNDFDFYEPQQDADWADSFTTDREDDKKS
mmetsp:Transcript_14825/g.28237  ORF Transcript_14825/g.28237 Transcript_14825/m.28237 type:complete len:328 (-) Transcript_14825:43-1026(-)|eukprot:scaffold32086_cov183-Amphora_coffeaeformis.AAC.12